MESFVFKSHPCFLPYILVQGSNWFQNFLKDRMIDQFLANGTQAECECNPWSWPSFRYDGLAAVEVEDMATLESNGRSCGQGFCEANHAHVVGILFEGRMSWIASMKARETGCLVSNPSTDMSTGQDFRTCRLRILLTF